MTSNEVEQSIAKATGKPLGVVKEVMDALVSFVTASAISGEKVFIRGLGVFTPVDTKGRIYNNGVCKNIAAPARRKIKFTPSKQIKNTINR